MCEFLDHIQKVLNIPNRITSIKFMSLTQFRMDHAQKTYWHFSRQKPSHSLLMLLLAYFNVFLIAIWCSTFGISSVIQRKIILQNSFATLFQWEQFMVFWCKGLCEICTKFVYSIKEKKILSKKINTRINHLDDDKFDCLYLKWYNRYSDVKLPLMVVIFYRKHTFDIYVHEHTHNVFHLLSSFSTLRSTSIHFMACFDVFKGTKSNKKEMNSTNGEQATYLQFEWRHRHFKKFHYPSQWKLFLLSSVVHLSILAF